MGEKAADDVVINGGHVFRGGLGEQARHFEEVPDDEPGLRAADPLLRHDLSNPLRGEVVTGNGHPYGSEEDDENGGNGDDNSETHRTLGRSQEQASQ